MHMHLLAAAAPVKFHRDMNHFSHIYHKAISFVDTQNMVLRKWGLPSLKLINIRWKCPWKVLLFILFMYISNTLHDVVIAFFIPLYAIENLIIVWNKSMQLILYSKFLAVYYTGHPFMSNLHYYTLELPIPKRPFNRNAFRHSMFSAAVF